MSKHVGIYLGIGANLSISGHDNPKSGCLAAIDFLTADGAITLDAISPWYRTAPVPVSDQPWFYNAVLKIKTELSPSDLIQRIHNVEAEMGRVRLVRNEARVIDIDIIDYSGLINKSNPILPHPRMHQRAFVLYPLRDVASDWVHPVSGLGIEDLIAGLEDQNIHPE